MKYTIRIVRTEISECEVEVDADTREEASRIASETSASGGYESLFGGADLVEERIVSPVGASLMEYAAYLGLTEIQRLALNDVGEHIMGGDDTFESYAETMTWEERQYLSKWLKDRGCVCGR